MKNQQSQSPFGPSFAQVSAALKGAGLTLQQFDSLPADERAAMLATKPAAGEAEHTPELYWNPCPDTNRAFLSLEGVDNNVAEVFPVDHMDYISAADVACRIARRYNSHAGLVKEMSNILSMAEDMATDSEKQRELKRANIVLIARSALKSATEGHA